MKIIFSNKNELTLKSNSLVVLDLVKKENSPELSRIELKIPYGQVEMKSPYDSHWKIENNNKEHLELKSSAHSELNIDVEKRKSLQVFLKRGTSEVVHKGKTKSLSPSNSVEVFISDQALAEIKNEMINNVTQIPEVVLKNTPNLISNINSKDLLKLAEISQSQLRNDKKIIEKDDNLKNNLTNEKKRLSQKQKFSDRKPSSSNEKSTAIPLLVQNVSKNLSNDKLEQFNSGESEISENNLNEIRVSQLKATSRLISPTGRVPFHKSVVYLYKGNKLNVRFMWGGSNKDIDSYVIQVSINDLFKPVLLTKFSNINSIDINLPNSGKYYWRVKGLLGVESSQWSEVKEFFLEYSN